MIIKSSKHDYFVLVMLEQSIIYDLMLACYDNMESPNSNFSIVRVKDVEVVMGLTSFFLDLENTNFTDFSECFIFESDMHLVFRYEHQTDAECFNNCVPGMKLVPRAKAAKAILSKLILQRMAYPVMCSILKPENIIINSNSDIFFNYFIFNFDDYQFDCKNKAMVYLSYLLTLLLEKEIKHGQCPELNELIINIQKNQYEDMTQIYREFSKVYDKLMFLNELEPNKGKSIEEVMDAFRKTVLERLKPLFAMLVIFIGLFYLYTLISQTPVSTQRGNIEAIGDFIIE